MRARVSIRALALAACLPASGCELMIGPKKGPDGQPIVFAYLDPVEDWTLYRVGSGGGTATPLDIGQRNGLFPEWSPDRTQLAFVSRSEPTGLYLAGPDGSNPRRIFETWDAEDIAWSPDGAMLAVSSFTDPTMPLEGIVLVDEADGEARTIESTFGMSANAPSWSSSGIVFGSAYDAIVLVQPDGSGSKTLVSGEEKLVRDPAWSPDGSRLAFAHGSLGQMSIYTVDAEGNDRRRVTSGSAFTDLAPAWSPSGRWIAFQRGVRLCDDEGRCDTRWDIYIVRSDGSDLRNLTAGTAGGVRPTW